MVFKDKKGVFRVVIAIIASSDKLRAENFDIALGGDFFDVVGFCLTFVWFFVIIVIYGHFIGAHGVGAVFDDDILQEFDFLGFALDVDKIRSNSGFAGFCFSGFGIDLKGS